MQFVAATWHSAIEMVAHIENSMRPSVPPQQETLARFAADLERQASGLDGEMPVAVETFIRRYSTPPV
jgi:hypothetical protein